MSKKKKTSISIPKPGQGKRGEAGYMSYLLRQAAGMHRQRMERALSDVNVTLPQYIVLTMLGAYPGHSNADLARLALLTPQTVCVIVANLEKMGAITRKPDAIHGRIVHLQLTDSGKALLSKCKRRAHTLDRELSSDLPPEHEQIIRRWLVDIAKRDCEQNETLYHK